MSTEATGDDRTDSVGTVEPDVAAERTGPVAAAAAEREAVGEPREESASGEEIASGAGEQPAEPREPEPSEEDGNPGESPDSGETEEPDEIGAGFEGHEEDYDAEEGEYDEGPGDDGNYGEYGPEDAVGPQRPRRWPRVLLALGFTAAAAAIVGGAVAIVGSATHGFKKPVKVTYKKSALFSLKTGECFNPRGQSYSLIPCDSPHGAEVFATFALSGSKWPGAAAVAGEASGGCAGRLTGYLNPQLAISLSSTYVYPDSVAWQAGTRTVVCEVRATSGQLTGSVRDASATAG